MKKIVLAVTLILTFSSLPTFSATPPKPGSVCSKQGITKTYKGKKYTCIKKGKKLVWNKGVVVKNAAPIISPLPTPKPTPSPSSTISTSQSTPWKLTNLEFFDPIQNCRVGTNLDGSEHLGFPRPITSIPTLGNQKSIMLFIDFPDAMGDQEVLNEFIKVQIPTMKQGLEELSYGQLTSTVDVVNKYFRLQKSIEYYNLLFQYNVINYANQGLPADAKLQEFLKDVVEVTDPQVDFSKYDFVSIITSNGSRLGLDGSVGFRFILDGKAFNFAHMSFSSTKEYFGNPDKATSLLHDVGHMMGIPHGWGGFPYGNANNPIINVPIWSLMATGGGSPHPDLLAWERFLLSWIDEKNVLCISEWKTSDFTIEIGRINQVDTKTKMVVIRLNKYEAIIIESPDDTVFDYVKTNSIRWKYDGSPGVIIYSLNTNIISNYGAFRLLYPSSTSERMDGRPWGLTKVNESVEIASRNIKIRVLNSDTKGHVIEVLKIES